MSVLYYIVEKSLEDILRNPTESPILNKHIPMGGMKILGHDFDPSRGIVTTVVESSGLNYGNRRARAQRTVDKYGNTKSRNPWYDVSFAFDNWKSFINESVRDLAEMYNPIEVGDISEYVNMSSGEVIDNLFRRQDVKINCNCPSFHWAGVRYRASGDNTAEKPTRISDPVWFPLHRESGFYGQVPWCKHVNAAFEDFRSFNSPGERLVQELLIEKLIPLVEKKIKSRNKQSDNKYYSDLSNFVDY